MIDNDRMGDVNNDDDDDDGRLGTNDKRMWGPCDDCRGGRMTRTGLG